MKKLWILGIACALLAGVFLSACGSSGSDSSADAGTPDSDDSGIKSAGVAPAPPFHVNPESPSVSSAVTVTVSISDAASAVTFTASGTGCGTVANTSGANPLVVTGTAGSNGYCEMTASATVGSATQAYAGRFEVLASDPNIPPINITGGVWTQASMPAASSDSGKPVVSGVDGPTTIINGSSNSYTVSYSGSENVSGVLVQVGGYTNGYYFVPATGSGGTVTFELNVAADYFDQVSADLSVPLKSLAVGPGKSVTTAAQSFVFAVVDILNRISAAFPLSTTARQVGTGDVKVSISWDTATDVDLHVTEPDGDTIWYGDKGPTATGGQLDLDSNPACNIDGINNENIYWPEGQSPQGGFSALVRMYSNCPSDSNPSGISPTTVTLTITGCGTGFPITETFTLTSTGTEHTTTFTSLCQRSVQGTIKYEDFAVTDAGLAASGVMVPVRYAKVKVLRASDDTMLAEDYTTGTGYYYIPFTNDGDAGYYVQVYAQSDDSATSTLKQEVQDLDGNLYAFRSDGTIDETQEPIKVGLDIEVTRAENAGALNIWDVGVKSSDYARARTGSTPSKVVWYWTAGEKPGGHESSYFSKVDSPKIFVLGMATDPDEYDDMVLGHEYGHFIHYDKGTSDSPGGKHYIDQQYVGTLSWSEGWATFFAGAAYDRSSYADTNSTGMGVFYSFETLPAAYPLGNAGSALDGNVNEALVSAVLHDLHDSANETDDTLSDNSTAIWQVLTTYLKTGYAKFADRGVAGRDLVDFLDGWFCLGYANEGDEAGADANKNGMRGNVIGLHQLSYDFPDLASCK